MHVVSQQVCNIGTFSLPFMVAPSHTHEGRGVPLLASTSVPGILNL